MLKLVSPGYTKGGKFSLSVAGVSKVLLSVSVTLSLWCKLEAGVSLLISLRRIYGVVVGESDRKDEVVSWFGLVTKAARVRSIIDAKVFKRLTLMSSVIPKAGFNLDRLTACLILSTRMYA